MHLHAQCTQARAVLWALRRSPQVRRKAVGDEQQARVVHSWFLDQARSTRERSIRIDLDSWPVGLGPIFREKEPGSTGTRMDPQDLLVGGDQTRLGVAPGSMADDCLAGRRGDLPGERGSAASRRTASLIALAPPGRTSRASMSRDQLADDGQVAGDERRARRHGFQDLERAASLDEVPIIGGQRCEDDVALVMQPGQGGPIDRPGESDGIGDTKFPAELSQGTPPAWDVPDRPGRASRPCHDSGARDASIARRTPCQGDIVPA